MKKSKKRKRAKVRRRRSMTARISPKTHEMLCELADAQPDGPNRTISAQLYLAVKTRYGAVFGE